MQNMNIFGNTLHSIRKDRGLLQKDFPKYGITQSKISKIENGFTDISLVDYEYLLSILNIRKNEFDALLDRQSFVVQELSNNALLYIISQKSIFLENYIDQYAELKNNRLNYNFWRSIYLYFVAGKTDNSLKDNLFTIENFYINDFLIVLMLLPQFNKYELVTIFELLKKSLIRNSEFYGRNNIVKACFFQLGYLLCLSNLKMQAIWIIHYFESFQEDSIYLLNFRLLFEKEYLKKFSHQNSKLNKLSKIEKKLQVLRVLMNE